MLKQGRDVRLLPLRSKRLQPRPSPLYANKDGRLTPEEMQEGWRRHAGGACSQRVFEGGHFYLNTHRADLLRALSDDLATIV